MLRVGVLVLLLCISVAGQLCKSPIDIAHAEGKRLKDLNFHYDAKFAINVSFIGAVGRVEGFNVSATPPYIAGGGMTDPHYLEYVSVYGHASAHTIDGIRSAFELVLFHRSKRGTTVALSIRGTRHFKSCWWSESCSKQSMDPLISALKKANTKHQPTTVDAFSPDSFLPSDPDSRRLYWSYNGTVIGQCDQPATYFVLKEPLVLPDERMETFRSAFSNRDAPEVKQETAGPVYRRCCL